MTKTIKKKTGNLKKQKIVYVLGAGFSIPAGTPPQSAILQGILEQKSPEAKGVKKFINHFFGKSVKIPLEDIYTALDKSILKDESLRGIEMKSLWKTRNALNSSIAKYFEKRIPKTTPIYIKQFSQFLLNLRWNKRSKDRIAIISTNWDTILDNSLGFFMQTDRTKYLEDKKTKEFKRKLFIDYCMYDRQLNSKSRILPSIIIKARGYFNLKYLKVHGSMNWLRCPNCESVFVTFDSKEIKQYKHCRACIKNHTKNIILRPFLISPTFLKDLNSVSSKSVWWNAGFELSEASHIVFIGYSLPLADFELKYLFARNIKKDVKIKVVLKCDSSGSEAKQRYEDFFGNRGRDGLQFEMDGVEKYVENLPKEVSKIFW